jgi:hypothetical protein
MIERKSRLYNALSIINNSRIKQYEDALIFALENNYKLVSLRQFLTHRSNQPHIILRHDVDQKDIGVKEIFDIEEKLGVSSSWYFRWSTVNPKLIRKIAETGSEVGLHYETLATICQRHGLSSTDQITPAILDKAREEVKMEVIDFRERFRIPCLTIASHGHPLNTQIRISNNELITPQLSKEISLIAEAYDPELLSSLDCYLSDASPTINYGWAYNISLENAIIEGHQDICFLSHPHHWYFTNKQKLKLTFKLLTKGMRKENRVFRPTF